MRILVAVVCLTAMQLAAAERLRVAVASNFLATARAVAERFEQEQQDVAVDLISGSTGKLYAQIANGAPFDVFLAADAARPERLEQAGLAVAGSRFTYATGALYLWARNVDGSGEACVDALLAANEARVAIANPATAPYGLAAQEYLEQAGLLDELEGRLVVGENIAQTLQFVSVGGADFGFIAGAQLHALPSDACLWRVPSTLYTAIRQQAVLLQRAADRPAAKAFLEFLRSDARPVIEAAGYEASGGG